MKNKPLLIALTLFFLTTINVHAFSKPVNAEKAATQAGVTVTAETGYLSSEIGKMDKPAEAKGPGIISTIVNLVLGLLFVIGLAYLVMIGLKFFYVRASIPLKSEGIIRIIAREHLDTNKTVYAVEFADRILLIGSAGESISLLSEVKDQETVDRIKQSADEYISKYKITRDSKFADELKANYVKQGKKIVDSGNKTVKNFIDKLKSGGKHV
jgi:flagellar biogenesis protein FliO